MVVDCPPCAIGRAHHLGAGWQGADGTPHLYAGLALSGGGIKRLETPLEAAAREAKEEAGVELLEAPMLLRIVTSYAGGRSDHVAVYLCRKFRIELATDRWEIAECKLFALDALPSPIGNIWLKLLQELAVSDSSAL